MADSNSIVFVIASFAIIALAAREIGRFFAGIKLPLITGFLFTGIAAGPFVLGLISVETTERLRAVAEVSLAFIAFAAGSSLYWRDLRGQLRSIQFVTIGLVVSTFTLGSITVFLLTDLIPFMQGLPVAGRIAISILAGTILVARSPASAVAVIKELRAKGPFTQTAMAVTVIMDVAVITLFAVNTSIADALLTGVRFNLTFIGLLVGELLAAVAMGAVAGMLLQAVLWCRMSRRIKTGGILLVGYGVFSVSAAIRHFTQEHWAAEVFIEPLLICMIGGFVLANYTRYRDEFLKILHDIGPWIFVVFFLLVGASLKLDLLGVLWPVTLVLFVVRLGTIFVGSFTGGVLAGERMAYNRVSWMAYITQAGVGLGLAQQVAVEFPAWGEAFATMMISVIVLNQVLGPAFFRSAIIRVNEAGPRAKKSEVDQIHRAIIFGSGAEALTLARQLRSHGWEVTVADRRAQIKKAVGSDVEIHLIGGLSLDELRQCGIEDAGAIITMLSDEENLQICQIVRAHCETVNLSVQLNDPADYDRFRELGAHIVSPSTAVISLLDHFVRSPSAVSLLLGEDKDHDVAELMVRNPKLNGVAVRDLNLPPDTLILSIYRGAQLLLTHGYTQLRMGDRVTVVGSMESLGALRLRFSESWLVWR